MPMLERNLQIMDKHHTDLYCSDHQGAQMHFDQVYITTITNWSYYKGLKVLIKSFRKTNSLIPLFVMLPTDSDEKLKSAVRKLGVPIIECDTIPLSDAAKASNKIEHWNQTFFKLNIMRLTQFKKLIYIDADMLILKNIDHLFAYPAISATTGGKAAHPEWTEFNSGLMVVEPNLEQFHRLIKSIEPAMNRRQALNLGYGDQDVFNQFYPAWHTEPEHHFDEIYNAECCYLDALMQERSFQDFSEIYILHYIGANKIWNNSLIKNLRIIRGRFLDKNPYEAKAYLLYLRYLYL